MKHHRAAQQSGKKARNSRSLLERIQADAAGSTAERGAILRQFLPTAIRNRYGNSGASPPTWIVWRTGLSSAG
jgi:hypothetical protein